MQQFFSVSLAQCCTGFEKTFFHSCIDPSPEMLTLVISNTESMIKGTYCLPTTFFLKMAKLRSGVSPAWKGKKIKMLLMFSFRSVTAVILCCYTKTESFKSSGE